MTFDTLMALCLLEQLVAALRANDPDLFKRWLCGSDHSLGKLVVAKVQARGGAQINLKPANRRPRQQGSGEIIRHKEEKTTHYYVAPRTCLF